jgi:hypothetical protein
MSGLGAAMGQTPDDTRTGGRVAAFEPPSRPILCWRGASLKLARPVVCQPPAGAFSGVV